ncbi:MAG: hypothetical protein KKA07_02455 [Bacteroidetes bacterium]|nr:hypothetical protein [Bacteroidota bacterium]MBU1717911.1 hypothetical protein [Bacteroidota bacterium]
MWKKIILLVVLSAAFSAGNAGDDVKFVLKDNAFKAVELIKSKGVVVLYCACCDKAVKRKIIVSKVFFKFSGIMEYWNVIVEGTDANGKKISETIDLRSAHIIKDDNLAYPICSEIGMECKTCTEPFKP